MDGTKELIPKNIITVDEELDEFSNRPVANKTLFKKFQESAGMQNPMTTAGDIIVGGTSGTPGRLAKGNEGDVLAIGSDGPEWVPPAGGTLYNHSIILTPPSGAVGTYAINIISDNSSPMGYNDIVSYIGEKKYPIIGQVEYAGTAYPFYGAYIYMENSVLRVWGMKVILSSGAYVISADKAAILNTWTFDDNVFTI